MQCNKCNTKLFDIKAAVLSIKPGLAPAQCGVCAVWCGVAVPFHKGLTAHDVFDVMPGQRGPTLANCYAILLTLTSNAKKHLKFGRIYWKRTLLNSGRHCSLHWSARVADLSIDKRRPLLSIISEFSMKSH